MHTHNRASQVRPFTLVSGTPVMILSSASRRFSIYFPPSSANYALLNDNLFASFIGITISDVAQGITIRRDVHGDCVEREWWANQTSGSAIQLAVIECMQCQCEYDEQLAGQVSIIESQPGRWGGPLRSQHGLR